MQPKNHFENKKVKSYRQFELIDYSNFEVYKVIDIEDNNSYKAIKVFPKEFLIKNPAWIPAITSEVNILKKCKHQNIILFYEFLETQHHFYLVMEYCKDGNLSQYLKIKNGRLAESEAIDIFKQILNGYHELYTRRIMHRDLKLSNILLNEGIVKLADFGFAKEGRIGDSNVGTAIYKAPDVARSSAYDGPKADIWSLGICLYELLFGKLPFDRDSIRISISAANGNWKLVFPENIWVSKEIKQLLLEMINPDPERRLDWAGVFQHGLFRNVMNSVPFTKPDIFLLAKSYIVVENEEILLQNLTDKEEKSEISFKINFESEVDAMVLQEIQAKAMEKDIENIQFKKKVKYFEKRYLHHSNVLKNMAFVLENGLKLDPEINDAIYGYTLLSKKLLLLTEEFLSKLESKKYVFSKEDYDESSFDEFKKSLFHHDLPKVIEEEYKNYKTFIEKGVFFQFYCIEYSHHQFFKNIKLMIGQEKPDMDDLNKTFLNLLQDYLFMKKEGKTKNKEIWTQLFYLYHCYQYLNYRDPRWELMFDDSSEEGFDFFQYRKSYKNMEECSEGFELQELLEKLLFL